MDKENKTVLVIDDEQDACWLVRHILEEKGYSVLTATSGEEGVEKFKSNLAQLGLVFLDLKLPDVDGLKICKRIKEEQPELPVVIMTAYGTEAAREQAQVMKVHKFIDKPLKVEVVLDTASEILGEAPSAKGPNADEMRNLLEEVSKETLSSEAPDKDKAMELANQLKAICGASPDWLNKEIQTRVLLVIVALEDLSEPDAVTKSLSCIKGELPPLQKELEGIINPPAEAAQADAPAEAAPEKPQEKETKTEPIAEEKPEKKPEPPAEPPVETKKTPAEAQESSAEIKEKPAEAEKPHAEAKKAAVSAEAPSAEVEEPPVGIKKSLAGVKKILAKVQKPRAKVKPPAKQSQSAEAAQANPPADAKKAPPVDIKFIFSLVIILLVGFSFYQGKTSLSKAVGLKNAGSLTSAIEWYSKSLGAMPLLNKKAKEGLRDAKSLLKASSQSETQKKIEMSKAALDKENAIASIKDEISTLKTALGEKEKTLKTAQEKTEKLQGGLAATETKIKEIEEAKAKTALELKDISAKFTALKQNQDTLHKEKSQWTEEKTDLLSQISKLKEEKTKLSEGLSAPKPLTEKEIGEIKRKEERRERTERAKEKKEAAEKKVKEKKREKEKHASRLYEERLVEKREKSLQDPYAISAVPTDKYEITRNMTFIIGLIKKGNYDEASGRLAEMLTLDPGNNEARFLFNTITDASSAKITEKRLREKLPPPLISTALKLIAVRKYKEAEEELNRYLAQHPSDTLASGLLVKARMLNGLP